MREYFTQYLISNRGVGQNTIKKYISAIGVITTLLNTNGYMCGDLFEVNSVDELDRVKVFLDSNEEFQTKDSIGNRMYSVAFNHFYRFACLDVGLNKAEIQKLDIVVTPKGRSIIDGYETWIRNKIIVQQAIRSVDFNCEYNYQHKTFTSNVTKKNYVEGHHLIPMKHQNEFSAISLDVYANIVSLCPNCHRLLHHGVKKEKIYVLEKIYDERQARLANSGIDISIKDLISLAE